MKKASRTEKPRADEPLTDGEVKLLRKRCRSCSPSSKRHYVVSVLETKGDLRDKIRAGMSLVEHAAKTSSKREIFWVEGGKMGVGAYTVRLRGVVDITEPAGGGKA